MSATDRTELRAHLAGNLIEARKAAFSYLFDGDAAGLEQWQREASPITIARDAWGRLVVEARVLRSDQHYALADGFMHFAECLDTQAKRLDEQAAEALDHALSIGAFDDWTMSESRFSHPLTPIKPWKNVMASIRLAPRPIRPAPSPTL